MSKEIKVVELFAGVGGFRLGLDGYSNPKYPDFDMEPAGNFHTIWANNWEPDGRPTKQFAWRCYEKRFGEGSCVNEDIAIVVEQIKSGERELPEFDMLVGGFPCQDYSVAKPASLASGIEGKKGVLWWSINAILEMRHPKYVLLENVDRLLKSPTAQRGRDFAIILSCLYRLGYSVEWHVVNAADYGMPQRRRRVDLTVSASYRSPVESVKAALLRAANSPTSLFTPEPFAGVKEYGDSAITYVLQVWSSAPDYWTTYFTVNEAISREFAQDGIEMTYPHLNVHLDSNP